MTSAPENEIFFPFESPVEDYFSRIENLNFTFERSAGDVPSDFVGLPTDLVNDTIDNVFNGNATKAKNFFLSLYQTIMPGQGTAPIANFDAKESWEKFVEAISAISSQQNGTPESGPLYEVFINHFKIQHEIPADVSNDLGDFEVLYQALGAQVPREEFLNTIFKDVMTLFLTRYVFRVPDAAQLPQGGPDPNFDWLGLFMGDLSRFLTARATIDDAPTAPTVNLSMYEKIFNEFVPQPPVKPFDEVLAEFYNESIEEHRFFLPSHRLGDWVKKVQERQVVETNTDLSIAGTNSARTQIILIVLRLLVEVIEVLQNVAAAQGGRLQFYAEMQRSYTDLIGQMPIISGQDITQYAKRSGDRAQKKLLGFSQATVQSFTEQLRTRRSTLGDEAKQHQTTVNQSNEIVTQQANLGTSLLQQLSTILTNMFK